jgi:hypothetical protein
MRELTVQVSDNQFEMLVNFLRTLPYVQLPSSFKKVENNAQPLEYKPATPKVYKPTFELASLGEMDETPFDIEYIRKNHTVQWEHIDELRELFTDAPFDAMLEDLSR